MIDTITQVLTLINAQLGHRTPVLALVVGFGFSIATTQYIKKRPTINLPRWQIRVVAFLLASVPTALLWPTPGVTAILVGAWMGLIAPLAYTVVARIAVHRWAWLDPILSADARPRQIPTPGEPPC
jgi:hypothetical protein